MNVSIKVENIKNKNEIVPNEIEVNLNVCFKKKKCQFTHSRCTVISTVEGFTIFRRTFPSFPNVLNIHWLQLKTKEKKHAM